jgi:hypothetical protein
MKTQMSLAAVSLALALASACAQEKAPATSGGGDPATDQEQPTTDPKTDDVDPNFDPSVSPADVDKKTDPGNGDAASVAERKVTLAFDAEKLTGDAGEAVVITIDHKKVTSSNKCAAPIEHTPVSESGYDANSTELVVEVESHGAIADETSDTVAPDYEVAESFTFTCGKSPLSVVMVNMDTGHQLAVTVTVHTTDATVFAETKPFIALNTSDGEKALTLDYPSDN